MLSAPQSVKMIANKAALLAVVAALAEQAQAFNSHRHLHNQLEKKAIEVEWHTVWETVVVTYGQSEKTGFVANARPTEPTTSSTSTTTTSTTSTTPTTTSTTTSTVVVPTTTEAPPPPPPATTTQPAPTTLATVAKAPAADASVAALDINVSIPPVVVPESTTTQEEAPATTAADSSSDSSSSSGSSSGTGSLGFSTKRGMAYNDATLANLFGKTCTACSWAWNWGSSCPDLDDAYHFVPMLWGPQEIHSANWDSDAEEALGAGAKALMSFNECDNAGQCNLGAAEAATQHAKFMNKYQGKALIGAPSISNSGNPGEGIEWLTAFFEACDAQDGGCAVDFCPVHWYSEAQYADTLFDHLEKAHEACGGKPVWLTEFAPFGSDDQISSFLEDVIPKLDSLDYLEAYSYFMVSVGSLLSSVTGLGSYGQVYASL